MRLKNIHLTCDSYCLSSQGNTTVLDNILIVRDGISIGYAPRVYILTEHIRKGVKKMTTKKPVAKKSVKKSTKKVAKKSV